MEERKKIGVAGVGNYILGDEGFGVHVIHYLQENYDFPDCVELQDVGTAGIYMAPFLEECDPVYIVDVVDTEGEPGSFHYFELKDLRAGNFQLRMSPHQLGLMEIMEIAKLRETAPEVVEFYTVVPEILEESTELSSTLSARKVEVAEMIIHRLEQAGISVRHKRD